MEYSTVAGEKQEILRIIDFRVFFLSRIDKTFCL